MNSTDTKLAAIMVLVHDYAEVLSGYTHSFCDKADVEEQRDALESKLRALIEAARRAPSAVPACLTCNGHGVIGNIFDHESCPDCNAPNSVASHQIRNVSVSDLPYGYQSGIQTDNKVSLFFKDNDSAENWFEAFMGFYDRAQHQAENAAQNDQNQPQTRMDTSAQQLPEGWRLVPTEATSKQMVLMAGAILLQETDTADNRHPDWDVAVEKAELAYRAALKAAPQPPSGKGDSLEQFNKNNELQERKPLTVDQIQEYAEPFVRCLGGDNWSTGEDGISSNSGQIELFVRAIEAAHGIKG